MFRIDALRSVAGVANVFRRDSSAVIVQFPRDYMSADIATGIVPAHDSINAFTERANPEPAIGGFVDVSPETFFDRFAHKEMILA